MKVTVENKKGLNKDLKVFIDKKTMTTHFEEKYNEIKDKVVLKGFRPGKVPREILKRQFGQALMGEVLDKVLKETTTKALEDNKIKPAGQPKIDLKTYGEDKDLEYIISVTEMPKIDTKLLDGIKFDEYEVNIDPRETDKRIDQIAKSQKNFIEVDKAKVANEGDMVVFDYKATINGNEFKGNEGKNTQLELGKDLFIKGFDKQLLKVKKDEDVDVEVNLPENFPEKDLVGKKAKFKCKILAVKKPKDVTIDDEFAKNLGAKDLKDLKSLISKQINQEYKNSLDMLSKNQILDQIAKIKLDEIPENLLKQEIDILSQGMKDEDKKKNQKKHKSQAERRIKTGLILNEFGETNKITVTDKEIQNELQKQLGSMPGQEKFLKEYYEKNPSALASLRGSIYEDKILNEIKSKGKANKKTITKSEAEKILKEENEKAMKLHAEDQGLSNETEKKEPKKATSKKEVISKKKPSTSNKKTTKTKKVSKK
jgi:trigger factor